MIEESRELENPQEYLALTLEQARGHIWTCKIKEEGMARELEKKYHVSLKQYVGDELRMKFISEAPPGMECSSCEATLEDAYIYIANKET